MKKRKLAKHETINGFYISDLVRGFFGDHNEGATMLKQMGLSSDVIPFSVAVFLDNRKIRWKDQNGKIISISFTLTPDYMEFHGSYLGKHKSIKLFREWHKGENDELITRLESEAIGDCCARCIYENMN